MIYQIAIRLCVQIPFDHTNMSPENRYKSDLLFLCNIQIFIQMLMLMAGSRILLHLMWLIKTKNSRRLKLFIHDALTFRIQGGSLPNMLTLVYFGRSKVYACVLDNQMHLHLLHLVCVLNHLLRLLSDWISIHLECALEGIYTCLFCCFFLVIWFNLYHSTNKIAWSDQV